MAKCMLCSNFAVDGPLCFVCKMSKRVKISVTEILTDEFGNEVEGETVTSDDGKITLPLPKTKH